jgi:hypothetical protein
MKEILLNSFTYNEFEMILMNINYFAERAVYIYDGVNCFVLSFFRVKIVISL